MRYIQITRETLPEAYHSALCVLEQYGEMTLCPDWNTVCKEINLRMVVTDPLKEPRISMLTICGPEDLKQYCLEMLEGILDFEIEDGKWEYTYHNRIGNQFSECLEELKRNKYSRRAIIDIRRVNDYELVDPPCLQQIQFLYRDGALDMEVLFRSNDAVRATFMNAFALIEIQKAMADLLNMRVGKYVHTANSFHAYETSFATLKGYCDAIEACEYGGKSKVFSRIVANYEGDWKEMMDEAEPDIRAKVENLMGARLTKYEQLTF